MHLQPHQRATLLEIGPAWVGYIGLLSALIGQLQLNRYLLWGLLPATVGLVLWALRGPETSDDRKQSLALLNLGIAVILGLHFWHLGQSLPGLFYDEAVNIREGLEIVGRAGWQVWSGDLSGRPTLFLYLLGWMQQIFGNYWMVARTAVVVVNVLTVLAMVWALHPLLGPRKARIAAIIFGASAYHLLYSRIIYEASVSSLPLLIAIGAAVRATYDTRRRWWVVLGVACGVGLLTYAAFRLAPPFIFAAVAAWAIPWRSEWRRIGVGIAASAVIALAIASPLIWVAVHDPGAFVQRARETTIAQEFATSGVLRPLAHNLATYGGMFVTNPATSDQIYHFPALGTPAAVLLWVGLGLAIGAAIRGRAAMVGVVAFWWFAGLIPGIITVSIEAPHWSRTLYALPAVAVIVAVGVEGVVDLVGRRWRTIATAAVLVIIVAGEAWAFHYRMEKHHAVYDFFFPVHSRAAAVARERVAEGYYVFASDEMVTDPYNADVFWTIAADAGGKIEPLIRWGNLPLPGCARLTCILLSERDHNLAPLISLLYPEAEVEVHRDPWDAPLFWELKITEGTPPPGGKRVGALFPSTGEYRFAVGRGAALRLEELEIRDGDRAMVPAGIWRVECEPECAEAGVTVSGAEGFKLRDALVDDAWAGHGLLATYLNADGSTHVQLDRVLEANKRGRPQTSFRIRWDGWLDAPTDGRYRFWTVSDDGSRIWIDDELIVDNWGAHGMEEKEESLELERGEHSFLVEYEELGGGAGLEVAWAPPGAEEPQELPLTSLRPLAGPQGR